MASRMLLAMAALACAAADETIVQTAYGKVQGYVNPLARVFKSIPYASPPVGSSRWQDAQPPQSYAGILNATADPPGCIQHCGEPPQACPATVTEDCLFLNVFTPRLSAITAPLPVLIFIHGGNFKDGFGGGPLYDGSVLASSQSIILVSINYRLGALGFLFTGNDTSSDPSAIHGNYGLSDQRQAFKWVKQNIAAFGGDPARVTISGQSAGAMSVASHLISPASKGLFDGAIMESEPFALPFRTPPQAASFAAAFANFTGCTDNNPLYSSVTECLRNLSSDVILSAQLQAQADIAADLSELLQVFMPWSPVWNTEVLPTWPIYAFQKGEVNDVPIMAGVTSGEGFLFIYAGFPNGNMTAEEYGALLLVVFGLTDGTNIGARYPVPNPPPPDMRPQTSNVTTKFMFECPTRNATLSLALHPTRKNPVYLYKYDHVLSWGKAMWNTTSPQCWNECCHGDDLPIVFHPNYPQLGTNYTAAENILSQQLQSYWGSFVRNGYPGNGGAVGPVEWKPLDASKSMLLYQTPANSFVPDLDNAECDFWDSFGYTFY